MTNGNSKNTNKLPKKEVVKIPMEKGSLRLQGISTAPLMLEVIMDVDGIASRMEARWGTGVLQNLVEPGVKDKFGRAYDRLNNLIETAKDVDYEQVKAAADNVARGWLVLDRLAGEAGHTPDDNIPFLKCSLDDQRTVYLVQDYVAAARLAARKPEFGEYIMTTNELTNMLRGYYGVKEYRNQDKSPLDDEMPF